jgi:hypothetical protein
MNPVSQSPENAAAASHAPPARRGDVSKCPVCGSAVDAQAYHCPTCRSYFCYHCRARLLESDTQLQCLSQNCDYYGKLVCGICDPPQEKDEPPSIYAEPEDGYWPAWLIVVLIAAAVLWYHYTSFQTAAISAIVTYVAGGYLLHRVGLNIFGKHRRVEQLRKSTFHTCIHCQNPVKELHKPA